MSGRKRGITVKRFTHPKLTFVAFAALAIALAVYTPSEAAMGGHGFGGGHAGGAAEHHGFDGQHGFDGHHGFDGRHFGHDHFGFGFAPVFPYYGYPYYGYYPPAPDTPAYWYYCPTYGAYYPNVSSCPDAWVPVPAS